MSAKPVTIRGKRYRSMTEAAKAIGVGMEAISRARKQRRLSKVGLTRAGRGRGLEVTLDGRTYPSVAEAARQTGISYWTLYEMARAA